MEELTNFLTQTNQLWEEYTRPARSDLDVTDVWQRVNGGHATVIHRRVQHEHAGEWLKDQSVDPNAGPTPASQPQSYILQVVWVKRDTRQRVDHISDELLTRTLDAFELKAAYRYSRTSFAGVTSLPDSSVSNNTCPPNTTQKFVVSIHPKLTLVWSHDRVTGCTRVICLGTASFITKCKLALDARWSFAAHPLFPAFVAAVVLAGEIDNDQNSIKNEVRETEARTGFHRWSSRGAERPAPGDLSVLSARMSGCATKLASVQRKTAIVQLLHCTILDQLSQEDRTISSSFGPDYYRHRQAVLLLSPSLHEATTHLQSRLSLATADTVFINTRTTTQLTALAHLITQHDTLASQSVAQDSRILALASHHDSRSMKTLAVVTMFFLPGTFVASLFATPFFAVDSTAAVLRVTDDFGLYWAVTLPLTVLTLGVWAGWSLWRGWRDRGLEVSERRRLGKELAGPGLGKRVMTADTSTKDWAVDVDLDGDGMGLAEIGSLVRKRTAMVGKQ